MGAGAGLGGGRGAGISLLSQQGESHEVLNMNKHVLVPKLESAYPRLV